MHAQVEMMAIKAHVQVPSRSLAIQVHVQMYADEQKQVKHGYSIGRVWSPSCGAVLQMRQSNITHVSLNAKCLVKTLVFEMQAIAFSRLRSMAAQEAKWSLIVCANNSCSADDTQYFGRLYTNPEALISASNVCSALTSPCKHAQQLHQLRSCRWGPERHKLQSQRMQALLTNDTSSASLA